MRALLLSVLLLASPALADEAAESAEQAAPSTFVQASVQLQVHDRAAAAEALVSRAEALGGYFSALTDERVVLRLPSDQARDFVDSARELGRMVDSTWNAQDLHPRMADLQARLSAREEVLAHYQEVLATASPKAVVLVERQITQTVAEIEDLRGSLRLLQHQASLAQVEVRFRAVDRRAPARTATSSFPWINSLNVADVLSDFRSGRAPGPAAGLPGFTPDGFAPYPRPRRFRAVSPDDVVYRMRSVRHRPVADLPFWQEAVRERMQAAGYTFIGEQPIEGPLGGTVQEWLAPLGAEDFTYLVGFFVRDRRIVLVEAAGEASRFNARREAILQAVEASGR